MKHYALPVVAALLMLAGCEDQEAAENGTPTQSPAIDAAVAPANVGVVSDSGAASPDAGGGTGVMSAAAGRPAGLTGGTGGGIGAPFDASGNVARDAGAADAGATTADAGTDTGTSAPDGSAGTCVKGQTKGSEVGASHFDLGRRVSRFALDEGPFRAFKEKPDLAGLVASLPVFHQAYFVDADTRTEAVLLDDRVEFRVLRPPERHRYFEQLIVGYISGVLELYCANPIRVVRSQSSGRDYAYWLCASTGAQREQAESRRADAGPARSGIELMGGRQAVSLQCLSSRELEVLLLIARGKTNKEIGVALGISGKTAQHHIARAYRKIGVSGRVDAALWLTGRGIVPV